MEALAEPVATIAAISAGLLTLVVAPIVVVRAWLTRTPAAVAPALEVGPPCPSCSQRTVRAASFCHACGTSLEDRRW